MVNFPILLQKSHTKAAALALALLASAGFAAAQESDVAASQTFATEQSEAQLLSAVTATGDLASIPIGAHIKLAEGWKTYWRSPGDAGLPATIDISGSSNVSKAEISWPAPHRFELFGLQTFGYGKEVVLPVALTPVQPGEPIALKAQLRYLVCETVCVPQEAALDLDLPAGPAMPTEHATLISRFTSLVPQGPERLGWQVSQPAVSEDTIAFDIVSTLDPFEKPDVIIEGSPNFVFSPPTLELGVDRRSAHLTVKSERVADGPSLAEQKLTFTIVDGELGAEIKPELIATSASAASSSGLAFRSLAAILGIALLGGLILNVMPCVLPVLALKLTGVLEMAARERDHLRGSFLATAAGILSSFLLLAGILIGVKAGGATIGWGIQFQQPIFLIAMALVCLVFAANLFGLFSIPMPAVVGNAALAGDAQLRNDYAKSFLSGVLATALATPCSAPFVGTAVGFALARGPGEIGAIFFALGLGLALPYLAVAAAPGLVRILPRPGVWMKWLKLILGATLVGTAFWLLGVMGSQVGWLNLRSVVAADSSWTKFDDSEIPGLVAQGKVVFVDVTADWCLTCQANKKLVLDSDPVLEQLNQSNVVAMKADWTNPDDRIAGFLGRHNRYGIPFNIVYGPKAPRGIVLPELLTNDAVLSAIKRAGG